LREVTALKIAGPLGAAFKWGTVRVVLWRRGSRHRRHRALSVS